MITINFKNNVLAAIKQRRANFASDAKLAVFLGVSAAQLSRVQKGELDNVLSDANWISLARRLDVPFGNHSQLITARTPVFEFITTQLQACQEKGLSMIMCDVAGIGKTYAARCYVRENKHAVYIDCSQVKSKQKLVRQIAKEFGLTFTGKYSEVYEDLVYYLQTIVNPLIVLDEAGDLDYPAFLELKALWNATEYRCGWYMMGADGLRAKIDNNRGRKKVGYSEIFRRYGERYQKVTPDGKEELEKFARMQIALVAKANGLNNVQELYAKTDGSLSRLYIEIQKLKSVN